MSIGEKIKNKRLELGLTHKENRVRLANTSFTRFLHISKFALFAKKTPNNRTPAKLCNTKCNTKCFTVKTHNSTRLFL